MWFTAPGTVPNAWMPDRRHADSRYNKNMNWLLAAAAFAAASTYQATSPLAPGVRDLSPAPGTTVKAFFPRFSATITTSGQPLQRRSLHIYVDGRDVTAWAAVTADSVQYVPRERLRAGWHDAFVEGTDVAGRAFSDGWVFKTQDPDIDLPSDDDGFAFLPAAAQNAPFTHFFLVSPFDGFGLVQLCGLQFPMTRVTGTPVFFVTVPVTLGTVLLGCTPGVVFTPFQAGIGELNPIFFPIEAAGPRFFGGVGHQHGRRHPLTPGMTSMPAYRTAPALPVYRPVPAVPVYRAPPMPMPMPVRRSPVIRQPHVPVRCCTHAR